MPNTLSKYRKTVICRWSLVNAHKYSRQDLPSLKSQARTLPLQDKHSFLERFAERFAQTLSNQSQEGIPLRGVIYFRGNPAHVFSFIVCLYFRLLLILRFVRFELKIQKLLFKCRTA